MRYELIKRGQSRTVQYSTKRMVEVLEDQGCRVSTRGMIMTAEFGPQEDESASEARDRVIRAIRITAGSRNVATIFHEE